MGKEIAIRLMSPANTVHRSLAQMIDKGPDDKVPRSVRRARGVCLGTQWVQTQTMVSIGLDWTWRAAVNVVESK